jgi:polyphosphate kinase
MTTSSDDKREQTGGQDGAEKGEKPVESPRIAPGPRKRPRGAKPHDRKRELSSDRESSLSGQSLDPSLYINRELSWLEFNWRVLEEARDQRHPLLERVKFLSIVSSNLDEFFMIRVAGIKEQILADIVEYSPDGQSPSQQLQAIHARVTRMLKDMSACFWKDLHPKLAAEKIHLLKMNELNADDRAKLSGLFAREIYPVLTPLAFDPGHPFPYISNLSLSLAVVVSTPNGEERFARVKVPDVLPRLIQIPNGEIPATTFRFVWLEDVIAENLGLLFPGMTVKESYAFRVTRNADIEIQEDEAEDLIHSIEESIRQRRYGSVVRVGVQNTMPARIKDILIDNLEVTADDVYELTPPLGLSHLMSLLKVLRPDLKDPVYQPATGSIDDDGDDIFSAIRRGDLLLHHPYDSFNPVVQFIKAAANDPNVLAIKQTLYRIGKESPLIPLFVQAAENGKQVAVLVELKARFDEENNIGWAKQLERAGVHVVYGLVGLKTHGKMALVVRKEHDGLRRYVHLGTGNYNPATARIYTDLSYLTCREEITEDATEVFNYLTGYSRRKAYARLAVAPVTLRETVSALIDREMGHARGGKSGRMILKMNALTDVKLIAKLYEASKAGVKIDLIVRGICSLRPQVKGISDNIRVISIVGRYLEHSRVFYFENAGRPELYLSSADLMGRNLDRRVELMFPVEDPTMAASIKHEVLETALADTVRARTLQPDGTYTSVAPTNGSEALDSQQTIMLQRTKESQHKKTVLRELPQENQP